MKINYANRKNDRNILKKQFKTKDINYLGFKGKITLINIEKVKKIFKASRPDGSESVLISNDYKIMTFFPDKEKYSMTVMYDNNWNLLQWYFDISRYSCKYDSDNIPYNEDLYLDIVVLPKGKMYILDENELKNALDNKNISKVEYDNAFITMNKLTQMIENEFERLEDFTKFSLKTLQN